MKTKSNYTIEKETLEEQLTAKRYNPAFVLVFKNKSGKHRVTLDSGGFDDIEVFREKNFVYVLSINQRMYYVGMQVFEGSEEKGNIFLQDSQDIHETLGRKGLDLSPVTIARRLKEYL